MSGAMFPGSFSATQCSAPSLQHFNGFLGSLPSARILPPLQDLALQPRYSLSTSHEAGDQQQQRRVIDERKRRRMISNRESARRSRTRKQRHLDELWRLGMRLRNENRNLVEQLNSMYESIDKLAQENAKLKEEISGLRRMLSALQIGSHYNALQDLDEFPCNTAHLRGAASSTLSVASSIGLLH